MFTQKPVALVDRNICIMSALRVVWKLPCERRLATGPKYVRG
jgi:hypothetical protein